VKRLFKSCKFWSKVERFLMSILAAKLGYNTIQLMAIMEHAYYGSFGYQVSTTAYISINLLGLDV
jgi:hypothetical protein